MFSRLLSSLFGFVLWLGAPLRSGQEPRVTDLEYRYMSGEAVVYRDPAVRGWMSEAYQDVEAGRFEAAKAKVAQALKLKPEDAALKDRLARVSELARVFGDWGPAPEGWQALTQKGALDYFYGREREALQSFTEAAKLNPEDGRAAALVAALRRRLAPPEAPGPDRGEQARLALSQGRLDEAVLLSQVLLREDPKNVLAYLTLALARYRQGNYIEAMNALESASRYETSDEARKSLRSDVEALDRLARTARAPAPEPEEPAVPKPKPAPRKPEPKKPLPPPQAAPRTKAAEDLDKLFDVGLQAYARGDFDAAEKAFQAILKARPDDEKARRAVKRIQTERRAGPP